MRLGQLLKRCIEVPLAAAALLISLPILTVGALLVLVASPGPVIFSQPREGRHRRSFRMYKLRTMHVDAESRLGAVLAADPDAAKEWTVYRRLKRDPRLIPGVGAFLRRTSIDELPQLGNVLRGDMSLVGPRPLELDLAEGLEPEVRQRRASVRPGMTGLWQVSGRSATRIDEMVSIDERYLREWTLGLDIIILARTPRAVLSRRGAY
jgi:lipopolysaccharide/colanic/teichoic acid biosynthesis glycosyltransferase